MSEVSTACRVKSWLHLYIAHETNAPPHTFVRETHGVSPGVVRDPAARRRRRPAALPLYPIRDMVHTMMSQR